MMSVTLTFTGAGFTYYVYKNQGIDLKNKLASQQAQIGKAVQKANLQKGDLLLFSTDNKGGENYTNRDLHWWKSIYFPFYFRFCCERKSELRLG